MKTHPIAPTFIALAALACAVTSIRANTIALDFTTNGALSHGGDGTRGWDFTLNSPVIVTDLGLWDGQQPGTGTIGDGFADPHTVTIWTSTGTFVTSAVLPAGMSGTLVDDFRYVSIVPMPLAPGSYVIGGYYFNSIDYAAAQASGVTTAPELTYGQTRSGSGNAFPTGTPSGVGLFGPNFQFISPNGTAVPEGGATLLLLGLTVVGLGGFHLRVSSAQVAARKHVNARND